MNYRQSLAPSNQEINRMKTLTLAIICCPNMTSLKIHNKIKMAEYYKYIKALIAHIYSICIWQASKSVKIAKHLNFLFSLT